MDLHKIEASLDNEDELLEFWRSLKIRPGFDLKLIHLEALSTDSLKIVIRLLKGLEDNSADYKQKCLPFMPGYQLMRSYLEETLIDRDIEIKAFDIDTRRANLGEELAGLVYRSGIRRHVIIVNSSLEEQEQDALAHQELRRILENPPEQQLRLIGIDALNHLEPEVDEYVEAIFSLHY